MPGGAGGGGGGVARGWNRRSHNHSTSRDLSSNLRSGRILASFLFTHGATRKFSRFPGNGFTKRNKNGAWSQATSHPLSPPQKFNGALGRNR